MLKESKQRNANHLTVLASGSNSLPKMLIHPYKSGVKELKARSY